MTTLATAKNTAASHEEVRTQFAGVLNAEGVAACRAVFEALAKSSARRVVLDLSGVSAIDGSGLGAISYLFKRLVARGRKLVLTSVAGQPAAMLTELGLARLLGMEAGLAGSSAARQAPVGGMAVAGSF